MAIRLVNPLNEDAPAAAPPAPRLSSLAGRTVALLDISKPGGSIFLDRVELRLKERYGVADVVRVMKPTFAKPAPAGIIEKIRHVDAVIEGLAD
jgi:hypothetical protein